MWEIESKLKTIYHVIELMTQQFIFNSESERWLCRYF